MRSIVDVLVGLVFGFKKSEHPAYPCFWCGKLTQCMDAEDCHVCEEDQRAEIEIGYEAMRAKYSLAGKDQRNPEYFTNPANTS
jgi:hypothetical protein